MDAERPMRSAEQETLKKRAATSFEKLKPLWMTSNSNPWDNCALHAANVKLGSSRVKGLLQAELFFLPRPGSDVNSAHTTTTTTIATR